MSKKFDRYAINHEQRKVPRQPPGRSDDDSLIDDSRSGAFGQGMPNGDPVPTYQNNPGKRQRTQQAGGGAPAGSYQGTRAGVDGPVSGYPPKAPATPADWNNLSSTARKEYLVKAITARMRVLSTNNRPGGA